MCLSLKCKIKVRRGKCYIFFSFLFFSQCGSKVRSSQVSCFWDSSFSESELFPSLSPSFSPWSVKGPSSRYQSGSDRLAQRTTSPSLRSLFSVSVFLFFFFIYDDSLLRLSACFPFFLLFLIPLFSTTRLSSPFLFSFPVETGARPFWSFSLLLLSPFFLYSNPLCSLSPL